MRHADGQLALWRGVESHSALFTEFLDLLIHDIDGKIFLIVDNVKYHASKETSEWVKEHRDRIELFFLRLTP